MLLAGDLGGTKTLLGLYERDARRPRPIALGEFSTLRYTGLSEIIGQFLRDQGAKDARIEAAAFGVAGPVRDQQVQLTNVPWFVNRDELRASLGGSQVALLNDVEAMGHAVDSLEPHEGVTLQAGSRDPAGNGALLAIGTGVGMAILHRESEHFVPLASEGGHADFAPRTEREIALLRSLKPRFGRVDIERVVSGPGLANIARFTHGGACARFPEGLAPADEPAHVTRAALAGTCPSCREALEMFIAAMGAVAGNLALTAKATGGLYVAGGVPAKILSALQGGSFVTNFLAKAPIDALLQSMPLTIVTLSEAGLLGAATYANRM